MHIYSKVIHIGQEGVYGDKRIAIAFYINGTINFLPN